MTKFDTRTVNFGGIDQLLWVASDQGAFNGPLQDWKRDNHLFLEKVKERNIVVQAGGNCGMYPLFYSKIFQQVYTFEPDDDNFHCLEQNCKDIPNIKMFKGGLGNTHDRMTLKKGPEHNVGEHTIVNQSGNIDMFRIDDLDLSGLDLLHLDIEGYESEALKGALDTIKKFSPIIITERSHGYDVIENLGYSVAHILPMDTIFFREFH